MLVLHRYKGGLNAECSRVCRKNVRRGEKFTAQRWQRPKHGQRFPRHGRFRQADTLGGTAETAFVRHAGEQHQVIGFEAH
jgi:hypothetical protein